MQNRLKMSMTAGAIVSLIALLISITPVAAQEGDNNMGDADTGSTTQQVTADDSGAGSTTPEVAETEQQQPTSTTSVTSDPCANITSDDDSTDNSANMSDSGTDADSDTTNSQAQTPCPGTNRETAGPNFAEPVQIAPGATHWYRFRYVFDEEIDDEPGQAVVSLKMNPVGCASFEVTTSGRLNFPFDESGDPVGPVGRGTPAPTIDGTNPGTLLWVGSGEFSETHFVIVRNRSSEPCTYTLSITGSPVVF
jgi:uncharacterized membrane protein